MGSPHYGIQGSRFKVLVDRSSDVDLHRGLLARLDVQDGERERPASLRASSSRSGAKMTLSLSPTMASPGSIPAFSAGLPGTTRDDLHDGSRSAVAASAMMPSDSGRDGSARPWRCDRREPARLGRPRREHRRRNGPRPGRRGPSGCHAPSTSGALRSLDGLLRLAESLVASPWPRRGRRPSRFPPSRPHPQAGPR